MPNWNKIRADYIRGGISQRALAKKYGVSLSSITKRSRSEHWADLVGQKNDKVTAKVLDSIASREADQMDKLQTAADMLLAKIIEGLTDNTLSTAGRGLRDISGALKDIKDIKGYKSDLDMKEQMARIEKLRKEATVEQQNNMVTVKFEGGIDDYAE